MSAAQVNCADVCVIVPFYAGDTHRTDNLLCVLKHYAPLPDVEILLVEQGSQPAALPALAHCVRRLFLNNPSASQPGGFNKSWGCNVAVRQTTRAILALMDADMLVDLNALTQAIKLTRTRTVATNPFERWLDLELPATQAILQQGDTGLIDFKAVQGSTTRREREQLNFCGGAFLIRREIYLKLGGYDERYVGWGGEDNLMDVKLKRSGQPLGQVKDSTAIHLWHPQSNATTFEQPNYACNLKMVQELMACDPAQLKFMCELQRQLGGHPRKYELALLDPLAGYLQPTGAAQ